MRNIEQLRDLLIAIEREAPDVWAALSKKQATERTLEALDALDLASAILELGRALDGGR